MRNPLTKLLLLAAGYWASLAFKHYVEKEAAKRRADGVQISTWEDEGGAVAPSNSPASSSNG